ncbi:MAG TPA: DedA family protein [Solirubrobacteraceae bacterium]|jgi:membrane protein DedA with SNARE-associated domain|nr:DedA family protein [Solirubrobacteraceae bacterium]
MLASITQTLTNAVADNGFWAVFGLMAVDAVFPLGGEITMVVAGAIAARAIDGDPHVFGHALGAGFETYVVLALAGTVGYLAGSLAGWAVGRAVGHEVLERHGHYVHLGPDNLHKAERWFERHGGWAVLLGRITPLVRSFVSIPAGLFGEPLGRYTALTTLGSAVWCFAFAGLGWALGSSYKEVDTVTHVVEVLIVVAIVAAGVAWLVRRRRRRAAADAAATERG